MILSRLADAGRYYALHPGFEKAFRFLQREDLAQLPAGRYEVDGDRLFVLISANPGRPRTEARLEVHRKYIDIQYAISGTDVIGWQALGECTQPATDFDPAKDIQFYADPSVAWVDLAPGTFMVFYPEDAHAPMAGEGILHKAVVKVAVEW